MEPDQLQPRAFPDTSAEAIVLQAEIHALHCRLVRHSPRRRAELLAMLHGALDAGAKDVEQGRQLFDKVRLRYQQVTQTRNQILYMLAAVVGAVLGGLASVEFIGYSNSNLSWTGNMANSATVASLCFYGLLGSLTSIFTRWSTMEMGENDSPVQVWVIGMTQPFIALGFVAVVYVIIKYQVLGIAFTANQNDAVSWVAAFLCGFSERFAPNILDSASKALKARKPASKD